MPWMEFTPMSQRLEFTELASMPGANKALLCRRFGISRRVGYKWLKRYIAGGQSALEDQSRRPHQSRNRTSQAIVDQVVALRQKHPAWGGRKLAARLKALSVRNVPAPSTITAILRDKGLLDPIKCAQRTPMTRFEHPSPNDLWQMDFKGHVPMATGIRLHPLTALDDHSRYNLILAACDNERGPTVQNHLANAFRRYGLPRRMLMDNGGPWGAAGQKAEAWTMLELWLMRLGVEVVHGRACHPQTQGKEERFHQTLQAELLKYHRFADLIHAQEHLDHWREVYNHQRPHEALALQLPAQRYQPSPRTYPETLPVVEYPSSDLVRKVKANRTIRLKGGEYRIGRAFVGKPVALRPTRVDGLWDVYYCHQRIGQLDQRQADARVLRACRPLAALADGTPEA